MPSVSVDLMQDAAPWKAFAPDGVTPSTELSLQVDTSRPRPNVDPASGRVSATGGALNHSLRRNLAGLDLRSFDALRVWLYSSRAADGTAAHPFFFELTLASAALGLDDPANTWRRYLPVSQVGVWEPVRLSLGDLDMAIRPAVTQIRFRCVSASPPFQCNLDDLIAVRDEMIADVDAALVAQLNNILALNGTAVPAVLHPAQGALNQNRPYFEITHYDIVYSPERTDAARPRGDFTGGGYRLRPPGNAYELYYQITAEADDRPSQSQMLEFALRTLAPRGELLVNGLPLPMESVVVPPFDPLGKLRTDTIPLFYRISTRQEAGAGGLVSPAKAIIIDGDLRS